MIHHMPTSHLTIPFFFFFFFIVQAKPKMIFSFGFKYELNERDFECIASHFSMMKTS